MKKYLLGTVLVLSLATALVAPAVSTPAAYAAVSAAPTAAHDGGLFTKAKFIVHVGLAYYVLHHFVLIPFRAHQLGLSYKGNTIKAGAALLFGVHELKAAYGDTNKDATLHKLATPLNAMMMGFSDLGTKLHGGNLSAANASNINNLNSLAGNFDKTAKDNGVKIAEIKPPASSGLF